MFFFRQPQSKWQANMSQAVIHHTRRNSSERSGVRELEERSQALLVGSSCLLMAKAVLGAADDLRGRQRKRAAAIPRDRFANKQ
jgi:hypothetical protein